MGKAELEWISNHPDEVERHSGKWIAFTAESGIIASGETVTEIINVAREKYHVDNPSVFLVPRKDEEAFIL